MWNRIVRVGRVLSLWGLTTFCGGCLRSHGPGEAANPGGNDATDGDAGPADASHEPTPGCTNGITSLDSLDLLFVIDDSESMREEQAALRAQLNKIVDVLTTGDLDSDGIQDQTPVHDLHLGVVSTDLGAAGLDGAPGCTGAGDDAVLQHMGNAAITGCASAFPSFLRYVEDEDNAAQLGNDFGCMSSLGTGGCAIEQPLEAALRALTSETNGAFSGEPGRQSALGIVIVSDEDDCSVQDPESFAANSNPADPPAPNLRCFASPDALFDPARYKSALERLRPGNEQLVFFGAIVGVPPDLLDPITRGAVAFADPKQRQARYDAIFDDRRMRQAVDPDATLEGGAALTPSCSIDNDGDSEIESRAYPPPRIVEVVREFGSRGSLFSICDADFSGVIQPMLNAIGHGFQCE